MEWSSRVWAQTCVDTNVCGHKRVWAQMCVGTNVCGHKRVWAKVCMGTNVWSPQKNGLNWIMTCAEELKSP